jgi:outer membrane protein OmpA-like peptidoglycan-associated protein
MHPSLSTYLEMIRLSRLNLIGFIQAVICVSAFSQSPNLVVNPSFEEEINFQDISHNNNWTRCLKNDTPDYIEFTSRGEPEFYYSKYIGGLLPVHGEAYVGIFCYRTNPLRGVENIREFIQSPLHEPLQKDTVYQVSLYIALDPESTSAINNFHVRFEGEQLFYKKEKQMFELHPQLRFRNASFDSIGWIRLEGNYKARGKESQIILGNFLNDKSIRKKRVYHKSEMMPKWNLHELERAAYYYIDQVSVVKASTTIPPADDPEENQGDSLQEVQIPDPAPATHPIEINKVERDSSIVLNHIFFDFDESILLPASYTELDRLTKQLRLYPTLSITIEGHTDNLGTYEYNKRLSIDRARAVAEYLLEKGLEESRISYEGFGYTRPLSDNRTDEGRKLNRRVAFRIKDINQ